MSGGNFPGRAADGETQLQRDCMNEPVLLALNT